MFKMNAQSTQVLALASSQAARFADDLVRDPIALLELHRDSANKSKQTGGDYSRGRDRSQHKGGIALLNRFKTEMNDSNAGVGETSMQLLARRLQ